MGGIAVLPVGCQYLDKALHHPVEEAGCKDEFCYDFHVHRLHHKQKRRSIHPIHQQYVDKGVEMDNRVSESLPPLSLDQRNFP
ncbi:hypothetical protein TcWFU_003004 [Taenia crassiceps]|uniref:Uncharacterized protein n=1 Tax=Taenia crassiceps TaxID=6207 RepID=A0ABR4Q148_9CEST